MTVIAAVDISASTEDVLEYYHIVESVLNSIQDDLKVIVWSSIARYFVYRKKLWNVDFPIPYGATRPETFMELLTHVPYTFQLYVFTDGEIVDHSVKQCQKLMDSMDSKKIEQVKIFYIGQEQHMNLKLTDIFYTVPREIYINDVLQSLGVMRTDLNFDTLHYDDIMKNNDFKVTILSLLNSKTIDPPTLKKQVTTVQARILKEIAPQEKLKPFYEAQNIPGCVQYLKTGFSKTYQSKVDFQCKIDEILNLFEKGVNTHSLHVLAPLVQPKDIDLQQQQEEEEEEEEEDVDSIQCDIMLTPCNMICLLVKKLKVEEFIDHQPFMNNPFKLFLYPETLKRFTQVVEPYVLDYYSYIQFQKKSTSPFTRNTLQGVYLFHHERITPKQLIRHNNFILSTLFGNRLPGLKPVWHCVLLYALVQKFPRMKSKLYEEIRYLGEHCKTFVNLNPFMNPPLYERLEVAYWYLRHISHLVYPNHYKNRMRSMEALPIFLQFYHDVYGPVDLTPDIAMWFLWRYFFEQGKKNPSFIFYVLAHICPYKEYPSKDIILLHSQEESAACKTDLDFVCLLNKSTILKLFQKFMKPNSRFYDDLSDCLVLDEAKPEDLRADMTDLLYHIVINLETCHPLVICPVTNLYWRDCVGPYDPEKESLLRIFRRYCIEKKAYPTSQDDLMVFFNAYLLKKQKKPEFFTLHMEHKFKKIMDIFKEVMRTYSVQEYLDKANQYCTEEKRRVLDDHYLRNKCVTELYSPD